MHLWKGIFLEKSDESGWTAAEVLHMSAKPLILIPQLSNLFIVYFHVKLMVAKRSATWPLRENELFLWNLTNSGWLISIWRNTASSAEILSRYRHGKLITRYSLPNLLDRSLARWFCDVTHGHVTLPFDFPLGDQCACADDAIMTPDQVILHRYRLAARHFSRYRSNVYIRLNFDRLKTIWPTVTAWTDIYRYGLVQVINIPVYSCGNRYSAFCSILLSCLYSSRTYLG